MTVNTNDDNDITIVGSPHQDNLIISEQLRNKLDHQLKEFRQQYHSAFNATKQQLVKSDKGTKNISLKNETHHTWSKNTTLIMGDSIVSGIEENRISRQWRKFKVKSFPCATIEDMDDYIKPLPKKCPKNIILHTGTNNTVNDTSRIVLDRICRESLT